MLSSVMSSKVKCLFSHKKKQKKPKVWKNKVETNAQNSKLNFWFLNFCSLSIRWQQNDKSKG